MVKKIKGKNSHFYHNVRLPCYREVSRDLGHPSNSVNCMINKRKRLLLQLGLAYKKLLDEEFGFDYYRKNKGDDNEKKPLH